MKYTPEPLDRVFRKINLYLINKSSIKCWKCVLGMPSQCPPLGGAVDKRQPSAFCFLLRPLNMAAFSQRIGRCSYDSVHKIRHCDLQNKRRNDLLQASSLFAKYRSRGLKKFGLRVVENAAERTAAGGPLDGHAIPAVTPMFVYTNGWRKNRRVANNEGCLILAKDGKTTENIKDCNIENELYWCRARIQRTFCTPGSAHPLQSQTRAYSDYGPRAEPFFKTKSGYYDILEVLPSSTQAQIKTAYYKQSFLYHPDRNAGSETATARFSDISEAYTVLGNKALRRKYDRGLLSLSDLVGTTGPSGKDAAGSGAKPRPEGRQSAVGADSRERIHNFDEFLKSHYKEQLRKERETRVRREEFLKKQTEPFEEKKNDYLVEQGSLVMIFLSVLLLFNIRSR